jgi:hypothetical protein
MEERDFWKQFDHTVKTPENWFFLGRYETLLSVLCARFQQVKL